MGSEGRRGSVKPQYKAGILGMEMLPPLLRPLSPVSPSISPFTGLHQRSLKRVPTSLSTRTVLGTE